MKEKITLFSMMKQEPQCILNQRLKALSQLTKDSYDNDWVMESFDMRDERGFGVLSNMADNNINICQYGVLTTLEQLSPEQLAAGVVVCDLFDAMSQYDLTAYWKKLPLLHQAFTNSGVFVYVPAGKCADVRCYFVQDNSVDEIMVKTVVIVKGKGANITFQWNNLAFGNRDNVSFIEVIEEVIGINEIT